MPNIHKTYNKHVRNFKKKKSLTHCICTIGMIQQLISCINHNVSRITIGQSCVSLTLKEMYSRNVHLFYCIKGFFSRGEVIQRDYEWFFRSIVDHRQPRFFVVTISLRSFNRTSSCSQITANRNCLLVIMF